LERQSLPISNDIIRNRLQVGCQDLGVLGVNDFTSRVHRHRGFFPTELNMDGKVKVIPVFF
jgi:hypothetical protein